AMDRRRFLGGTSACLTGLGLLGGAGRRPRRGINLCGAEFGTPSAFCNEAPGTFGKDYTYNSERTLAYFVGKGVAPLGVPFRWERVQPRPGGPLAAEELDWLSQVVRWAGKHGGSVVLDVHNFGRYRLRQDGKPTDVVIDRPVGGATPVSRHHFADLWRR